MAGSNAPAGCHDYLPFGEELNGIGGRTGSCWGAGETTLRFTGKERDAETTSSAMATGLDYFGARYYTAAIGRFTSVDKPFLDQNRINPQSWNLLTYARNNPLKFIDPSGNVVELLGDEEQRKRELDILQKTVDTKAGAQLYVDEVKDGDQTHYQVGIKGDVGDFMRIGKPRISLPIWLGTRTPWSLG